MKGETDKPICRNCEEISRHVTPAPRGTKEGRIRDPLKCRADGENGQRPIHREDIVATKGCSLAVVEQPLDGDALV